MAPDSDHDIWESIRGLPIEIFSLPNQKIEDHATLVTNTPTQLYLKPKSPAVVAVIEGALPGGKYKVEFIDQYIVISNKTEAVATVVQKPHTPDLMMPIRIGESVVMDGEMVTEESVREPTADEVIEIKVGTLQEGEDPKVEDEQKVEEKPTDEQKGKSGKKKPFTVKRVE
jgi:hypothetical protein